MAEESMELTISRDGTFTVKSMAAFQAIHKALSEGFYVTCSQDDSKVWIPPHDVIITSEGDLVYRKKRA